MFPALRKRFGSALIDRLDLLVEVSTLGEYGLAHDGLPTALEPECVPAPAVRRRGHCVPDAAARPRRGSAPAAN